MLDLSVAIQSPSLLPFRFIFRFLLFLLIVVKLDFDSCYNERFFLFVQFKKNRRKNMQLMKGIVSKIRFPIPFFN